MGFAPAQPPRDISWYGDPRDHAAKCNLCPLQGSVVVPYAAPEPGKKVRLVIVGEGPGRREELMRTPFVGITGQMLDQEIEAVGLDRSHMFITNAALCAGFNDKDNERAAECCAPRLLKELAALPADVPILTMGKAASKSVLGVKSVLLARGFVWTARDLSTSIDTAEAAVRKAIRDSSKSREARIKKRPVLIEAKLRLETLEWRNKLVGRVVFPTLHPTFAFIHNETWAPIFRIDIDRCARFVKKEFRLEDLDDRITRVTSLAEFAARKRVFIVTDNKREIAAAGKILADDVSVDIETEATHPLSPLLVKILCVQIGDRNKRALTIGPWDARRHAKVLTKLLATKKTIVMHNGFNFDQPALERIGEDVILDPTKIEDTLVAHHAFASQYPQRLDHVVSTFCLSARTPVLLFNGKTEKIAKIVANEMPVSVMTLGPNGIEPQRVVGWHRNRVVGQQWIRIRTTDQVGLKSERQAYGRGLVLTPEHQVLTGGGWTRADAIRPGDTVAVPERRLAPIEIGALIGTLMGDSAIQHPRNAHAATFKRALGGTHAEYTGLAQAKEIAMRGFLRAGGVTPGPTPYGGGPARRYYVPQSRQVYTLAKKVYDVDGAKRLTAVALDAMGPVGLAWWYMDDGSNAVAEKSIRFATHCFDLDDLKEAAAWFEQHFGRASIYDSTQRTATGRIQYILALSVPASEAFCEMVAPYIFPCMRYKLPRYREWPAYVDQPLSQVNEPLFVRVVEAGPYEPLTPPALKARGGRAGDVSYCLTVESNRNFFTPVALVANCDSGPWKIKFGRRGGTEKGLPPQNMDPDELYEYGSIDPILTALAWDAMQADLEPERKVYEHDKQLGVQGKLLQTVGIAVDVDRKNFLSKALAKRAAYLKGHMRTLARRPNFAPSKLGEVRKVLFNTLKAPMLNPTATGLASTSNATLEVIRTGGAGTLRPGPADVKKTSGAIIHDTKQTKAGLFAEALLNWRVVGKIRSTYIEAVQVHDDRRAHYNWRPYGTVSGRFACRLQSAPRWSKRLEDRVREIYTASQDCSLVYFDLSQAEMRMAAALSGDAVFMKTCEGDVHTGNAKILFPDAVEMLTRDPKGAFCPEHADGAKGGTCNCGKPFRDIAKNAGFAVSYLAEAPTVFAYLRSHGFPVEADAVDDMLMRLKASYSRYYEYVGENVRFVEKNGYLRTAVMGRIRWFGFHPKPTEIANFGVQAGIADAINLGSLYLQSIFPPDVRLIANVHDALIWDVPNKYISWATNAKGKQVPRGPVVEEIERLWAKPIHLPQGIICREARDVLLPCEVKVGDRWNVFG